MHKRLLYDPVVIVAYNIFMNGVDIFDQKESTITMFL